MPVKEGGLVRKPEWLKIKIANTKEFSFVSKVVSDNNLHTICSSGKCPNMSECWNRGTATFMILGDICTRNCKFCATKSGKPLMPDAAEAVKLARSVSIMKLKHCVITSVDRDDLSDGGASHWVECVTEVRKMNPQTTIEVLIPDFDGDQSLLNKVLECGADIYGHNIETVRRLTPNVRSRAEFDRSLGVLKYLSNKEVVVKSGLMVGIGETDDEVIDTLQSLHDNGCSVVTIGQYLQPTQNHLKVERYVTPEQFASYKESALKIGFQYVESAPMVRSSYMAEKAVNLNKRRI